MRKLLNKKGFTLIELIVVMAIIAILVLLAAPRFLGYTKDANVAAMQADAKVLSNAALQYNIKTEEWPVTYNAGSVVEATVASGSDLEKALLEVVNGATPDTDPAYVDIVDMDVAALLPNATKGNVDFSDLIKNTKNNIDKYYLITAGKFAGEVFYETSLGDSTEIFHNGVYKVTNPNP